MPGGRPGPALFELLRDKTGTRAAAPTRPAAPVAPAAPAPPPAPAPVALPAIDLKHRVSVTMSTVWIGVGAAVLVLIAGYSIVYKLAYKRGETDATRDLTKGGPITEPLHADPQIPVNPNLVSPPPPRQSPLSGPGTTVQTASASPTGDPRVAGFNYLTIASKMDRETAERAVAFLTENGVKSFKVAVARTGSGANNPPTYTVYALQGITREELRANAPVKTDLLERVARLGKIWQKEHKGQTDFSRTYWDKFGS